MTSNCATNILPAPMPLFAIHISASTTRIKKNSKEILSEMRMLNLTKLSTFQVNFWAQ